jgi:hypothetical protein
MLGLHWKFRKLRHLPLILHGTDGESRRIAGLLIERLKDKVPGDWDHLHLLRADNDYAREFKEALARLADAAHSRGEPTDVECAILFASWRMSWPDAKELLLQTSHLLESLLSRGRSMNVVLLLPPLTAGDAEKNRVLEGFLNLEKLLGDLPILGSVFLHQLSVNLYEQVTEMENLTSRDSEPAPDGDEAVHERRETETPPNRRSSALKAQETADAERAPDVAGQQDTEERQTGALAQRSSDLLELLFREFLDTDMIHTIRAVGYHTTRSLEKVRGRRASYSSMGVHTMTYFPDDLVRYLIAQFQYDLFYQGMYDYPSHLESPPLDLARRARDFLTECERFLTRTHADLKPLQIDPPKGRMTAEERADAGHDFQREIRQQFALGVERTLSELAPSFKSLDGMFARELGNLLASKPTGLLAGVRLYLEMLAGFDHENSEEWQELELRGIEGIRESFCRVPLVEAMGAYYGHHITTVCRELQLTLRPSEPSGHPLVALQTKLDDLSGQLLESCEPWVPPVQYLGESLRILAGHLSGQVLDEGAVEDLMDRLASEFERQARFIGESLHRNLEARQSIDAGIRQLKREYGWFGRNLTQREAFRKEKGLLEEQLSRLVREQQLLERTGAAICEYSLQIVTDVVCPHLVRVLLVEGLDAALQKTFDSFEGFMEPLRTRYRELWSEASSLLKIDGLQTSTVLTEEVADAVFGAIIGGRSWADYAVKLFAFEPEGRGRRPSYRGYTGLHHHYAGGPRTLLDRTADFALATFAGVVAYDILDIVELRGKEGARESLEKALRRTELFPEFSEAMLPQARQSGAMLRVRVVRGSRGVLGKLRERYSDLLGQDDRFIEVLSPNLLDFTTFTFGFPAFLLHVLEGPRNAALDIGDTSADVLWPA